MWQIEITIWSSYLHKEYIHISQQMKNARKIVTQITFSDYDILCKYVKCCIIYLFYFRKVRLS